jgi:hypothetical protein
MRTLLLLLFFGLVVLIMYLTKAIIAFAQVSRMCQAPAVVFLGWTRSAVLASHANRPAVTRGEARASGMFAAQRPVICSSFSG